MADLLTIAQQCADDISLAQPSTLFGNAVSGEGRRLLRFITRTCRSLAGRFDWSFQRYEHSFTTVNQETQTGGLPTDFKRIVPNSVFNYTTNWQVPGPISIEQWQSEKARFTTRVRPVYLIRNHAFLMTPSPPAGENIRFEYLSNAIGNNAADDTDLTTFTDDTDLTKFDDELVILGTVWRFLKSEGQDYSEDFREYELRYFDEIKRDGGATRLRMGRGGPGYNPIAPFTPETLVFD